jgi:hypothetical protein
MEIIGREIEFGVAVEETRGTAETTADKWGRKVNANVVERALHAVDETTRGVLEEGEGRRVVQRFVEGDVEGILHADMLGYLLANLYGLAVTTEVEAGEVYSHVFNLRQNIQHQALTLFAKDGAVQQHTFSNAMLSTLEISASIDDYVRFSAAFIAAVAATNSDTPSYDTEYDWIARDIEVKLAESEAGLSGASAVKAKDLSITFDQGVIRDHVVGSRNPDDLYNSKMMIEGTMTLNFTDEVFKDYYLGDDDLYMSITLTGEADLTNGENPTLEVLLHKVQFGEWNRSGGANDLVTQEVQFRAFYNASDQKQSQITLQNKTAEYPHVPTS